MTSKLPAICQEIKSRMSLYQSNLPDHMRKYADKFTRVANTSIMMNLDIFKKCSQQSVLASVAKASQDGLLLDGKQAALLPMKGEAKYVPMYQGLLKLVRNTGEISTVHAEVVFENDEYDYQLGDAPHIMHKPTLNARGKPVFAYAIAELKDGGKQRCVMTWEDIMKVKKSSPSAGSSFSPWNTYPEEMAKKTVLRRLIKYLPISTDIDAMFNDGEYEEHRTVQVQDEETVQDTEVIEPKRSKAAEKILNNDNAVDVETTTLEPEVIHPEEQEPEQNSEDFF